MPINRGNNKEKEKRANYQILGPILCCHPKYLRIILKNFTLNLLMQIDKIIHKKQEKMGCLYHLNPYLWLPAITYIYSHIFIVNPK